MYLSTNPLTLSIHVCPLIHLSILYSLVRPSIHSFIYSFIHPPISSIHPFIDPFFYLSHSSIHHYKYETTECCMTLPPQIYAIIMGGVFHETFISFITLEVCMFKDFNLLCWKEKSLRQPVM